jgi:CRP/FNR family transcriptional regulator, anaerobic regulatory protein
MTNFSNKSVWQIFMIDSIKNSILRWVQPTNSEWLDFEKRLQPCTFKKNQTWVQLGAYCQNIWFIEQGIARYVLMQNGEEKTGNISVDGDMMTEVFSFFTGYPAISSLQALTETKAWALKRSDLEALYETSMTWQKLGRLLSQHYLLEQIYRTHNLQLKSPEQRYLELLNNRPDLLQNVNLGILASHLNITQETLSRIRNRVRE